MVSIQERFLIKSGLWWREYGIIILFDNGYFWQKMYLILYLSLENSTTRITIIERLPSYNQEHLIEFSQREVETLIHGDFHGGNHKFGVDQNEGQVIVYDFQITGGSLASIEVLQALCNIEIANHSEVDSIIKGTFLKLMVQTSMTSLLTHT